MDETPILPQDPRNLIQCSIWMRNVVTCSEISNNIERCIRERQVSDISSGQFGVNMQAVEPFRRNG